MKPLFLVGAVLLIAGVASSLLTSSGTGSLDGTLNQIMKLEGEKKKDMSGAVAATMSKIGTLKKATKQAIAAKMKWDADRIKELSNGLGDTGHAGGRRDEAEHSNVGGSSGGRHQSMNGLLGHGILSHHSGGTAGGLHPNGASLHVGFGGQNGHPERISAGSSSLTFY